MGKAEVGSTKWLSNNMKAKGLQRLRWYCQGCERQMRDENGFKQHCLSEAHNRNMQVIASSGSKVITDYSNQFKRDFLRLLRTAHGEKKVHANHFYQEYIADKNHVHMNATHWHSLTAFIKHLGTEGICRVEEGERGLEIAWVDDSPEALRRREAVAKKNRMEKGDEERQARMLESQIRRAQEQKKEKENSDTLETRSKLDRKDEAPISISLGGPVQPVDSFDLKQVTPPVDDTPPVKGQGGDVDAGTLQSTPSQAGSQDTVAVSISFSGSSTKSKALNVFSSKANPLKVKKTAPIDQPKKMSELERVMLRDKEEQNRKRQRHDVREGDRGKRIKL